MLDFFLQQFYDYYNVMFNFVSFYPVDQVVVMLCRDQIHGLLFAHFYAFIISYLCHVQCEWSDSYRLVLHDLVDQVVVMLCFKLPLHDVVDRVVMMCCSVG